MYLSEGYAMALLREYVELIEQYKQEIENLDNKLKRYENHLERLDFEDGSALSDSDQDEIRQSLLAIKANAEHSKAGYQIKIEELETVEDTVKRCIKEIEDTDHQLNEVIECLENRDLDTQKRRKLLKLRAKLIYKKMDWITKFKALAYMTDSSENYDIDDADDIDNANDFDDDYSKPYPLRKEENYQSKKLCAYDETNPHSYREGYGISEVNEYGMNIWEDA